MINNVACVILCFFWYFNGGSSTTHFGLLVEPPARSITALAAKTGLDCGGPRVQHLENGGKCGLCGEPFNATLQNSIGGIDTPKQMSGSFLNVGTLQVEVVVDKSKGGSFLFEICSNERSERPVNESCFQPMGILFHGFIYNVSLSSTNVIRLTVLPPIGLHCRHCIFRWRWLIDDHDETQHVPYPIEFRNCADISLLPAKNILGNLFTQIEKSVQTNPNTHPPVVDMFDVKINTIDILKDVGANQKPYNNQPVLEQTKSSGHNNKLIPFTTNAETTTTIQPAVTENATTSMSTTPVHSTASFDNIKATVATTTPTTTPTLANRPVTGYFSSATLNKRLMVFEPKYGSDTTNFDRRKMKMLSPRSKRLLTLFLMTILNLLEDPPPSNINGAPSDTFDVDVSPSLTPTQTKPDLGGLYLPELPTTRQIAKLSVRVLKSPAAKQIKNPLKTTEAPVVTTNQRVNQSRTPSIHRQIMSRNYRMNQNYQNRLKNWFLNMSLMQMSGLFSSESFFCQMFDSLSENELFASVC